MNVHIVTDNPVYIDHFISKTQTVSKTSNFYIYIGEKVIENIKSDKILRYNIKELNTFLRKNDINKIFIHFLDDYAMEFLNTTKINIPVYWFFWGSDGYRHPLLKKRIYLEKTKNLRLRLSPRSGVKNLIDYYRDFKLARKMDGALAKIDFCCNQVLGDFNLIKSTSQNLKMQHRWFSYNNVELSEFSKSISENKNEGLTILLGNSANSSNNHLEAMDILKEFENKIVKIYCPLSYSGTKQYIKSIENIGKGKFGDKFVTLKDFLSPLEYNTLLDQVDVGFFYHVRQQAFSNSLNLLQRNKRIMMNPHSTLYKMYINSGVTNVFSNFDKLIQSDTDYNNNELREFLGEEKVNNWYKNLLD